MCAHTFVFIHLCNPLSQPPPIPHPPLSLNPCGQGCEGDVQNVVVSVYLLCLSLLSERNKSRVGDTA